MARQLMLRIVLAPLVVGAMWAAATGLVSLVNAQQQTTPCDVQLQIVEGGRKQAETSVAALLVRVQTLEAQLREAKAPQDKPAEKK